MSTEITVDTGTNELLCVIRDRVAIITLNRPDARNSLSDEELELRLWVEKF